MITIEHWKAKDYAHCTVHGVHWSEAMSCMYYAGRLPANYPVPAIGNEMILVHPVVLWMHWHCDEYGVMPD